jgi:Tfp pilus assembly protein PilF
MTCPHCSSCDTFWKPKAAKWECNSCEERFDGEPPVANPESVRPPLPAKAGKPKRIFFSYGHDANRELVDRFKADLEARGHQVWIDYKEIGAWDNWKGKITQGIHDAEMAIAFLSIHSTRDPGVCRNEVAMALQHFGKVYPVLVEQVPLESIPVTVAHLQWPDLSRWREFRDQEDLDFERFYEEKFLEIVSRVEGEAGRFASEAEVLRRVLNPSTFEGRFARHLDGFTGREWVFDAYEHWLDRQPSSRVFWVKAGPGFGKTALAVQMANRHRAAIVGTWFCDHQSVELRDPVRALQTIAYQLALRWDDYRVRLLPRLGLFADSAPERIEEARQELAKKSLQDAFSFLISEPMAGLIWREHKLVILIDALDEGAEADSTNPLAALISGRFLELPEWIGFVVTSRPDASVVPYLQGFKPFAIEAGDARNTADLQTYCSSQVAPLLPAPDRERLCAMLVEKSAGMMLYLRLVAEGLREGTLEAAALEALESGLPGLFSRYHAAFEARFRKDFQETVQPLLRLVMAAPGPIPLELAREVLGWDREASVRARAMIGSYLIDDQGGIGLFHKTFGEWLASEKAGIYFTDAEPGAKTLGEFLWNCFDERQKNDFDITLPVKQELFIISWLPKLIFSTNRIKEWNSVSDLSQWFIEKFHFDIAKQLSCHALANLENTLGSNHPDTLLMLLKLGTLLRKNSEYKEAELFIHQALNGFKNVLGPDHPHTLLTINELGNLISDNCDTEGAELLYRKALVGRQKTLGEDHPDTLNSLNNLGNILHEKKDYDGAEALYRRALAAKEKKLGTDHPSTLTSIYNLGLLMKAKGNYAEAEALFRRELISREKVFGADHPSTLNALDSLAGLFQARGDYAKAEQFYLNAIQGLEKTLGSSHPITTNSRVRLAHLFVNKMQQHDRAEFIYREVLEARRSYSGPEHRDTLDVLDDLAALFSNRGDFAKAEEYYLEAIKGLEKTLGSAHPKTTANRIRLARMLANKVQQYDRAEAIYREVLEARQNFLGPEHSDTLIVLDDLAALFRDCGDFAKAEEYYLKAIQGLEKTLGSSHPKTTANRIRLARMLANKVQQYDRAETIYREVLEARQNSLGSEHADTLIVVDCLAALFRDCGDFAKAEEYYIKAIQGLEKTLGSSHPKTTANRICLARMLAQEMQQYDRAESIYREVLEVREVSLGPEHPDTLDVLDDLAELFKLYGNFAKAEKYYLKAIKCLEKTLGASHPDTTASRIRLARMTAQEMQQYDRAASIFRDVLETREASLGSEHTDTLNVLDDLAGLFRLCGNFFKAEEYYLKAIQGFEKTLGLSNPQTTVTRIRFAWMLANKMQQYDRAESIYREVLEAREASLGPEHAETLDVLDDLAELFKLCGDFAKAEEYYLKAIQGLEKTLGSSHPKTMASSIRLARMLANNVQQYDRAETIYREVFESRQNSLGAEHADTLDVLDDLAAIFRDCGDFAKAEEYYLKAIKGLEKSLGASHPNTTMCRVRLARMLTNEMKQYDRAESIYREVLEAREVSLGPEHADTLDVVDDLGNLLGDKGDYEGAEALKRRALEGIEKAFGAEHADTLRRVSNLGWLLNESNRREAALELLRTRAALSDRAEDGVRYNLACYECLEGNHDEAKQLIASHLKAHPELKEQALADSDFTAIRDFIEAL